MKRFVSVLLVALVILSTVALVAATPSQVDRGKMYALWECCSSAGENSNETDFKACDGGGWWSGYRQLHNCQSCNGHQTSWGMCLPNKD